MISFQDFRQTDGTPIYLQIVRYIQQGLAAGTIQDGDELPSRRVVSALLAVNPNTVQRALTELEREGLLVGGGTNGRTVTKDALVLQKMRQQALEDLARECAEKFMVFGVSPAQAAELLRGLEKEEE